jgi:hypothetical protein
MAIHLVRDGIETETFEPETLTRPWMRLETAMCRRLGLEPIPTFSSASSQYRIIHLAASHTQRLLRGKRSHEAKLGLIGTSIESALESLTPASEVNSQDTPTLVTSPISVIQCPVISHSATELIMFQSVNTSHVHGSLQCFIQSCNPGRAPWTLRRGANETSLPNFLTTFFFFTHFCYFQLSFSLSHLTSQPPVPALQKGEGCAQRWAPRENFPRGA